MQNIQYAIAAEGWFVTSRKKSQNAVVQELRNAPITLDANRGDTFPMNVSYRESIKDVYAFFVSPLRGSPPKEKTNLGKRRSWPLLLRTLKTYHYEKPRRHKTSRTTADWGAQKPLWSRKKRKEKERNTGAAHIGLERTLQTGHFFFLVTYGWRASTESWGENASYRKRLRENCSSVQSLRIRNKKKGWCKYGARIPNSAPKEKIRTGRFVFLNS